MMKNKKDNTNIFIFVAAAALILLDQITKLAVKGFNFFGVNVEGMNYGESIPVIGDFLQLTYIENPGMAFGISFGVWKILLSLFSILASIALAWYITKIKKSNVWVRLGFMFIFAGAMGNLIDRVFYGVIFGENPLFYGRVVDFIQVNIPDINFLGLNYTHWPVFNVADSCVTIGVVILIIFHNKIPSFKQLKESGNPDIEPVNSMDDLEKRNEMES